MKSGNVVQEKSYAFALRVARIQGETVWFAQSQMAELFQTSIPNVSMHICNFFSDGEFWQDSVVKDSFTTAGAGISRSVLDLSISRERRANNENRLKP
jgi:hypothetical protein